MKSIKFCKKLSRFWVADNRTGRGGGLQYLLKPLRETQRAHFDRASKAPRRGALVRAHTLHCITRRDKSNPVRDCIMDARACRASRMLACSLAWGCAAWVCCVVRALARLLAWGCAAMDRAGPERGQRQDRQSIPVGDGRSRKNFFDFVIFLADYSPPFRGGVRNFLRGRKPLIFLGFCDLTAKTGPCYASDRRQGEQPTGPEPGQLHKPHDRNG